MRQIVFIILVASILTGCSKESGSIQHKVRYTTTGEAVKSAKSWNESTYTQFGTYITSLTPEKFTAKITLMCYQDNWDIQDRSTHIISYVDGHDNDPNFEMATYADFSGNAEVSIDPILYSTDLIGEENRIFKQKEVTFKYFNFGPDYFYQEVELPAQYKDIQLDQVDMGADPRPEYYYDQERNCVFLKSYSYSFLRPLGRYPFTFVFGNTESTYIFNQEGNMIFPSPDFPFGGSTSGPVVRSNKYDPVTVTMPQEGEAITMYSTVMFDSRNLIQVYAGADEVAYTNDDVFVYAPSFWERLNVKLEIK